MFIVYYLGAFAIIFSRILITEDSFVFTPIFFNAFSIQSFSRVSSALYSVSQMPVSDNLEYAAASREPSEFDKAPIPCICGIIFKNPIASIRLSSALKSLASLAGSEYQNGFVNKLGAPTVASSPG